MCGRRSGKHRFQRSGARQCSILPAGTAAVRCLHAAPVHTCANGYQHPAAGHGDTSRDGHISAGSDRYRGSGHHRGSHCHRNAPPCHRDADTLCATAAAL